MGAGERAPAVWYGARLGGGDGTGMRSEPVQLDETEMRLLPGRARLAASTTARTGRVAAPSRWAAWAVPSWSAAWDGGAAETLVWPAGPAKGVTRRLAGADGHRARPCGLGAGLARTSGFRCFA